jgi:hypothetical protein
VTSATLLGSSYRTSFGPTIPKMVYATACPPRKVVPVRNSLNTTQWSWRSGSTVLQFLTSARDSGKWSATCPGRLIRRERRPDTQSTERLVGPRAGVGAI